MQIKNKFSYFYVSLLCLIVSNNLLSCSNHTKSYIPEYITKAALTNSSKSFEDKIDNFSTLLIGTSYGTAKYKKESAKPSTIKQLAKIMTTPEFQYQFDQLDCVTYVETVLALALTPNITKLDKTDENEFKENFESYLRKIRYYKGNDQYYFRNHFQEVDWNKNNSWLITDITHQLGQSTALATCIIDKPNWTFYQDPVKFYIKQFKGEKKEAQKTLYLEALAKKGIRLKRETSKINYLPLATFLSNEAEITTHFPNVSIVNIIRPNWNLNEIIGTNLNISHIGFVFKKNDKLILRHASNSTNKMVEEIPLSDYLKLFIDSPTIKGIQVMQISASLTQLT